MTKSGYLSMTFGVTILIQAVDQSTYAERLLYYVAS